ncbi:MAG: ribonuclease H-like domain-containing protein [Minisyncoccia bacterium]
MDKIVFDIETKNSFFDVGGQDNLTDLEVSVAGIYSYQQDKYFIFDENELEKLNDFLKKADLVIGFASKRFDVPILNKYLNIDLTKLPHYDIQEEIQKLIKKRIGLGVLAEANLGIGKLSHGLEAIDMYQRGEIQKLKEYCLQDVKLTKELFDLIKNRGFLWFPQKDNPNMLKLNLKYVEQEYNQQFLV